MRVGIEVRCSVCGKPKAPHGRSLPIPEHRQWCEANFLNQALQCPGYYADPQSGCLFPGETEDDYGYECCNNATEEIKP